MERKTAQLTQKKGREVRKDKIQMEKTENNKLD